MGEDMFKRVESFVLKFWPPSKEPLSEDTRLLHDLGMDGTDAVEFMEAFSGEFDVDMSKLEFDRHFGPEVGIGLIDLFHFLYSRLFGKDLLGVIPITLRDLVSAAKAKKWHKLNGKAV
jgi:acyl carrier protein